MEEMIKTIHSLLEEADAVVHYNGTKFDIPTLNKEFILLGLDPPSSYKEIDLLRVARARFKFQSNKLDYVAQALGIGGKVKHKGMDLWKGCMENDEACWKHMEKYNKQDVVLLEKVYKRMLPWIKNHPNYGLYMDTDRPVCRNCGKSRVIKKGTEYTTVGKYQRYKCQNCGTHLRGSILQNNAEQRKKILR
jgi:DNA polymerase III epsilon subunit-like protein